MTLIAVFHEHRPNAIFEEVVVFRRLDGMARLAQGQAEQQE